MPSPCVANYGPRQTPDSRPRCHCDVTAGAYLVVLEKESSGYLNRRTAFGTEHLVLTPAPPCGPASATPGGT